jgi:hypothetical protein
MIIPQAANDAATTIHVPINNLAIIKRFYSSELKNEKIKQAFGCTFSPFVLRAQGLKSNLST